MHQLKADALEMKLAFVHGDMLRMAEVMRRSWIAKRATAKGVSNTAIDNFHALAAENGALAGKISGAGGGGFMMFFVRPEDRQKLVVALRAAGGDASAVAFTHSGSVTWKATT
ncbi:MAG: hypothetical protein FJX45_10345 [Alphaproteobacteria bacterium]|nr:hypothetical protein [Alphaproteobacteria bacterium]MBM3653674.1 hypothetical protein [Alphaproteobacteria bacterium]